MCSSVSQRDMQRVFKAFQFFWSHTVRGSVEDRVHKPLAHVLARLGLYPRSRSLQLTTLRIAEQLSWLLDLFTSCGFRRTNGLPSLVRLTERFTEEAKLGPHLHLSSKRSPQPSWIT